MESWRKEKTNDPINSAGRRKKPITAKFLAKENKFNYQTDYPTPSLEGVFISNLAFFFLDSLFFYQHAVIVGFK